MGELVRNMKIGEKGHWKPCQKGVILSTSSIFELADKFLNEFGMCFLLTARFNQDKVENFFSRQRLRNPTPTAYEFKNGLKMISMAQILDDVKKSSYLNDDSQNLLDPLEADLIIDNNKRVDAFFAAHPNEKANCEQLQIEEATTNSHDVKIQDEAILYNFCGFVIHSQIRSKQKKLSCDLCLSLLTSPSPQVGDQELSALVKFRDYTGESLFTIVTIVSIHCSKT